MIKVMEGQTIVSEIHEGTAKKNTSKTSNEGAELDVVGEMQWRPNIGEIHIRITRAIIIFFKL